MNKIIITIIVAILLGLLDFLVITWIVKLGASIIGYAFIWKIVWFIWLIVLLARTVFRSWNRD